MVAIAIAVVLVVIAALSFLRVYMSSEAIVNSIKSEEIASSISEARSAGSVLEVKSSVVANSATVKEKAKQLGMEEAVAPTYITLPKDVVAVNADGSLSLAESIRIASGVA